MADLDARRVRRSLLNRIPTGSVWYQACRSELIWDMRSTVSAGRQYAWLGIYSWFRIWLVQDRSHRLVGKYVAKSGCLVADRIGMFESGSLTSFRLSFPGHSGGVVETGAEESTWPRNGRGGEGDSLDGLPSTSLSTSLEGALFWLAKAGVMDRRGPETYPWSR